MTQLHLLCSSSNASLGEYEPAYAAVANSAAISTWPVNAPKRWTVLIDAVLVGDTVVTPTTTIPNVPSKKAVVLLDSGTSWTYVQFFFASFSISD